MTQCERILKYIDDFGSINPLEAMVDLGIMRLAARVSDLKKEGYPIRRKMVSAKNRYGETICFAEYRMEDHHAQ